jgi:hypothetical protein
MLLFWIAACGASRRDYDGVTYLGTVVGSSVPPGMATRRSPGADRPDLVRAMPLVAGAVTPYRCSASDESASVSMLPLTTVFFKCTAQPAWALHHKNDNNMASKRKGFVKNCYE